MKRMIGVWLLLAAFGQVFAQKNTCIINGKIKGLRDTVMTIIINDSSNERGFRFDTVWVHNESFTHKLAVDKPELQSINVRSLAKTTRDNGFIPTKATQLVFIAEPNSTIEFTGVITDFADAYPSGSKANDELAIINRKIHPLMNKAINMQLDIYNKVVTDTAVISLMKDTINTLDNLSNEFKKQFVQANPKSFSALWYLNDMLIRSQIDNDKAIGLFETMDKTHLGKLNLYTELEKRVNGIKNTQPGKITPDIVSTHTPDGSAFDLKKLRGKYVVLDFWGTWCGPCMAGMPKMKEYLGKYKNKMEIVGVAQESDAGQRWKKAIESSGLNWYHVLNRPDDNIVNRFAVAGFPTKIIVDPNGVIVARYVGEDEAIYKKLDAILN